MNHKQQQPWEFSGVWKTKAAYFSWLRGQLRRIWNKSPIKHEWRMANRERIENPNPKTKERYPYVWGGKCAITGKYFTMNELEVDHIDPAGSLSDWSDLEGYALRLLASNNLRFVNKEDHKIVSHAWNKGLTFEEAIIDKKVIAFKKMSASDQIKALQELDPEGEHGTNATQRAERYKELIS